MADIGIDTDICPKCKGYPNGTGLACGPSGARFVSRTCAFCAGNGIVTRDRAEAYDERRSVRTERVLAGKSLSEAAKHFGMTVPEYSRWEQGKDL